MSMFDSLHGRQINLPNEPELRRFKAHEYTNRRPALALEVQVVEESGTWWEPDLVLTVNIPEIPLPEGAFFVRSHGYERYLENLLATGLFKDMGVWVPQGYVEQYARVWRLKPVQPAVEVN